MAMNLTFGPGNYSGAVDSSIISASATRSDLVSSAVAAWGEQLIALAGSQALLHYRDLPEETLDLTAAHPSGLAMLLTGRITRLSTLIREPGALADARRRIRAIRTSAQQLLAEQGLAACWLAVGMASWSDPVAHRGTAPVLLRACILHPVGNAGEDADIELAPQVMLNPALTEYLNQNHHIDLAAVVSLDHAISRNRFDPGPVLNQVARAGRSLPGFTVDHRFVIGIFGYAGLTSAADLQRAPGELSQHDVIAALAQDTTAQAAVGNSLTVIGDIDPDNDRLVLDADSAQQAVIRAILAGSHVVLSGPPGTGKSQTIANLLAALAASGRRTLFVAEKRAALTSVVRRLQRVGLGDIVFSVGSDQPSAPQLAHRVAELLPQVAAPKVPGGTRHPSAEIRRSRQALNNHLEALHHKRLPWEVSAEQAQSALAELTARQPAPRSRLRIRPPFLDALGQAELAQLRAEVKTAAHGGVLNYAPLTDPWFQAQLPTSIEVNQAYSVTRRLHRNDLPEVKSLAGDAMDEVGLPAVNSWAELLERLELLKAIRVTLDIFNVNVFDAVLADQVAATATEEWRTDRQLSFTWWQRRRILRQSRRLLRPGPAPKSLHEALVCALVQREQWQQLVGPGARPQLPRQLSQLERAARTATSDLNWLVHRVPAPSELNGEGEIPAEASQRATRESSLLAAPLAELENWLATLVTHDGALDIIPQRVALQQRLADSGLAGFLADVSTREVGIDDVQAELDLIWWTSVLAHIGRSDPAYGRHDGDELREVQRAFGVAERQQQAVVVDQVRHELRQRVWHAAEQFPDQVHTLRSFTDASSAQGISPLLARAPQLLAAALPCWAMSPLLVAQTFAEGSVGEFDVVIIDEASQVPAAHVIPAIRRARQLVVVGDAKQLPPRDNPNDSILCLALPILPNFSLNRNYRSLAPELFSFANRYFYENSVATWATASSEPAVDLITVDGSGVLSAGATAVESTEAEVHQIIDLVLQHARQQPAKSLAVLTIGEQHARRLAEALRLTLADFPELGARLEQGAQPFSVKTIARAQGDEWDNVIFALGFGKTPHGRVLHNFGPLGEPGGENLVNIALTRARQKLTIVSAFAATDLDPSRLSAPGAKLLPEVLSWAQNHGRISAGPGVQESAPVVDQVLADFTARLRSRGVKVTAASGPTMIDLELHWRGKCLALGWDGSAYAQRPSTRDRDRLHREQLERRGWQYLQLWSTDVFRDPEQEVDRVMTELAGPAAQDAPDFAVSADDQDLGWGESAEVVHDEWLNEQRPPHWG